MSDGNADVVWPDNTEDLVHRDNNIDERRLLVPVLGRRICFVNVKEKTWSTEI